MRSTIGDGAAFTSVIRGLPDAGRGELGRPRGNRTPNLRFWRPTLCQLSYWPVDLGSAAEASRNSTVAEHRTFPDVCSHSYSMTLVTTPAPTVRPPSRMAKRNPSSIAIGAIRLTVIDTLSPGITISVPAGNSADPVTSVVRK